MRQACRFFLLRLFMILSTLAMVFIASAGIRESGSWIVDSRNHRFLTSLSDRIGTEDTELPKGHAVACISTSGCNFVILVVGPIQGDARKYAKVLDDWRATQGFPGDAFWTQEDDAAAARYSYHPGKVGMSHAETRLDLKSLRSALLTVEPHTEFAVTDAVWSKIDFGIPPDATASAGTRYWNLTRERPFRPVVAGSISVPGWMPWVLLLWLLLPPVGLLSAFATGIAISRMERIPIARRRKLYGRTVLGGAYGALGIHGVLVAATLPTRAFDPMTQLWFGQRFAQIALPIVPLFVIIPLLALPIANRFERKLMSPTEDEKARQIAQVVASHPVAPTDKRPMFVLLGLMALGLCGRIGLGFADKSFPLREPLMLAATILLFGPMAFSSFFIKRAKVNVEPGAIDALSERLRQRVATVAGKMSMAAPASRVLTEAIYGPFAAVIDSRGVAVSVRALEVLSDGEIDFLVGHELAHSRLGHLRRRKWMMLAPLLFILPMMMAIGFGRSLAVSTPAFIFTPMLIPIVLTVPYGLFLRRLVQRQELEADRLAIEATRDPGTAIETLVKITLNSVAPGIHDTDMSGHPTVGARIAAIRGG